MFAIFGMANFATPRTLPPLTFPCSLYYGYPSQSLMGAAYFGLGGGAGIRFGSRRKFALRLEGDYFGIRSSGFTTNSACLSAGIVYRIGHMASH